jgi:hypothetical protein
MKLSTIVFVLYFISILISCQSPSNDPNPTQKVSKKVHDQIVEHGEKSAYFGDLHVHTSWSFDAFIYNVRTNPDDAYAFGKGEPIDHFVLDKIQIDRPLDFMAVTDHSEYMGVMKQMLDKESPLYNIPLAEQIRSKDRATSTRAFGIIGFSLANNKPIEVLSEEGIRKSTWEEIVKAADRHNNPGQFTTFAGYEFTSSPGDSLGEVGFARNLHRNVIYKDTDKISDLPFSSIDSQNPEDLWDWMDKERQKGISVMAIPHNGNMSDGLMYQTTTFDGKPITKEYADQRMRNEPINEVVQIKGQSMSHPVLAPNDEFADFELFEYTFSTTVSPPSKPQGSYVRQAYQDGLQFEESLGSNPFKFGVIGSSDGHNSAAGFTEPTYFGKFGVLDGSPEKRIITDPGTFLRAKYMSSGGLAGVWAESNTREAIFEALERKETFATSGNRMKLRFYGGFTVPNNVFNSDDWINKLDDKSVPMGGDLDAENRTPSFAVWAVKDPEGANLDRIQIIKAWVDGSGKSHEKIINVAWSDGRKLNADGTLPLLESTVDVEKASYSNSTGSTELKTVWTDEAYNHDFHTMYYMRVLEIETPRWSTYDAEKLDISVPSDLPEKIVERAWSSPIWINAK